MLTQVNPAGPIGVWPALRVHECFESLADLQPAAPAIVSDRGALTYADLEQEANALAHALLAQGVMTEEAVGVLTERSESLPLAFLAILKAGGAYVPMGADLPPQRLATMATQSGMRRLIALDGLEPPAELMAALTNNAEHAILRPEGLSRDALARDGHRPNQPGTTADLAAILFTSGSTGRPKGVLLQHDACVNMGYGHIGAQDVTPDDRVLLASAPGFILGFRELCLPLLAGAAFVPASRALLDDPAGLLAAMSRHGVTVAMFTPSYLRLFHGAVPAGLRCLLTAGERPNAGDARAYARKLDYWNLHGATEVCGTICMSRVDPNGSGPLPSGLPFTNMAVYLLDGDGKEVPPGEVGEMHVVGVGVARGYLNQPDLTAGRFVETPYGRAYRSNDLGRWNNDGHLESVGRADDVVKVSGQTVSLGEIEQTLLRHEAVRHAAAMQHLGKLIAFVEGDRPDLASLEDWHRFLAQTLPAYMLPAQVTTLSRMPVNFYGKVDRQALLALAAQLAQSGNGAARGAPLRGEVERQIAEVWEEQLGVHPILRDDNFFVLGGTSLLSIAISQRLQDLGYAVAAQTILAATTVAALAGKIALASGERLAATASAARQDLATAGQADFWIAWKLGLATPGSQIMRVLAVRGTVPEPARWQSAWTKLVARHPALHTACFADPDDKVFWRTVDAEELAAGDQFSFDHCQTPRDARERIAARSNALFTLTEAPLARAGLVWVAEDGGETLFWFTLHHAVADGFSARIVQEEMHALLLERPLPPAPNGVAQASLAERQYLASGLAGRDRAWWRDKLDTVAAEAFHEFATDHRRPASPSGTPATCLVERLDAGVVAALTRLAQRRQVGLHALLLTLLAAEARRRDGRSSLIVGTAISVRPPEADQAVGYFVNLLPMVLTDSDAPPLAAQMRATQSALIEVLEHAAYPSGLLYREFRQRHPQARPQARTSLFDISLTANPSRTCGDAGTSFSLTPRRLPRELVYPAVGLDLAFSHEPVEDHGGGLELALLYDPDVYSLNTAQAWLGSFAAWARWLAEDTDRVDAPLPALLPEEARRLARWERGPARTRPAKRCHELFESLADRHPQRAAVIAETGVESYAELEHRANRIAWALLERGVAREEPVAVLTECSADLPAAVLGIWKAGAAYLPLALDQPPDRLAFMARDSGARALIVLDGHAVPPSLAQAVETILRSEDWQSSPAGRPGIAGTPQDLAYIIYTSGTTGMPKGVLIQHDGLVNAAYASGEVFGLTPEDRFSLAATPGFDASLWELGAALLHGMALVPVSRALRDDPWALKQWYKTHGVSVAFHAPSYLRVSQQTPFDGLRILITGGEAPNHDDARHHADHLAFWNAYGPTEACIFVCAEQVSPHPDPARPLSVGRPLPNTRISIRRDNGDPAPPGVVGEVWLSGTGLARGYLNNPDLTAQRFVETPEGRFYRTGDLGRWTEDGRLELSGRIDHQIKLHGQRLELGEIEQALLSHPAVEEAVTLVEAAANGTQALRAFVRPRPAAAMPAQDEWRAYLGERLPPYMVPASVAAVAAIPLTFAGKTDRDALLRSPRERSGGAGKSPPSGEMETRIAAVWGDLLGESVSRQDNFFALGGNSLLAVTMAHRLSRQLARTVPARELFAAPTLAGFARRIAELPRTSVPGRDAQAPVPSRSDLATEGQREFRVAEAAGLDTRTFTIPILRVVEGEMPSPDRWNKAWAALVARHHALRTYFHEDAEGRLRRGIVPALAPVLETATQPDRSAARAFVRQRQGESFVMGALPLWRAGLVEVADSGEHLFWLALHHSVGDGRSIGVVMEELGALLGGEDLPPLACDFGESAHREEDYLAGPDCAEDARYWRDLLARQPDSAFEEGPLDFSRSITSKTGTHRFETRLDAATTQGLKTLARQHEASLHAVMLTLLALEARRRMGRADVVIGTTADIRETAAEVQVIGYYVNMLPVPCHLPRQASFGAALRQTQQALAAGLQHARYPFARMYRDFWSEHPQQRHPARYPLFDLAVTENPEARQAPASLRLARISALGYELTEASPGLDMVLIHESLADDSLLLQWQVNAALYTRETARYWLEALRGWAVWLAEDCQRAQEALPALLPREAAWLEEWEQGAHAARPPLRFHEVFERVVDTSDTDRPAVVTQAGATTYAALEREANAIAHALLLRGAAPGVVVGVLTERSASLPAAVLGIWKAGATYLPLDAGLPPERLAFMARDAGIALSIALDGLAVPPALPAPLRPEEMDAEFRRTHAHRPPPSGGAGETAYIIYTSGSTGRPKGTLIGHDAYVNMVLGSGETLGLTHNDRSLMFSSPSFDVSLSDMGLPLAFGAALCPVPYEVLSSPNRFRAFLAELEVTVADITPTYLRLFDGAALPSLRILVTGGEAPFPADVETYAGRHQYFNAYGPTENTISSTMGRLYPGGKGALSGGRPLPNTSVHICDPEGNPVPPGVVGELWLGGAGLARGYVGRPELTAAAFVETARGRRYRSGDLGRWRATGEIEILGRIDDQVKLNGIRVELGEIEHAIGSHPDIAQAVALLDNDAGRSHSLWAFVRPLPGSAAPAEESWRDYLAGRLPAYMIPSAVIGIPSIPLSNSGKVDRAALKALLAGRAPRGEEAPPQEGLEAEIARVWSDLLGHGPIHRDDNFFALGGHSLLAIAVAHRLSHDLAQPVPARELFAAPTLAGFSQRIAELLGAALPVRDPRAPARIGGNLATEGQREFQVAEAAGLDTRNFAVPLLCVVEGGMPSLDRWNDAWATLVARHQALRTCFHEDAEGRLRFSAVPTLTQALETASLPDISAARVFVRRRQIEPFVMGAPPLWRAGLVEVTDTGEHLFWLALHHSVGDGQSVGIIMEELGALLGGDELPPLACDFAESASREEAYLAGSDSTGDARYWRDLLARQPDSAFDESPSDFPRSITAKTGHHRFETRLDTATTQGLKSLARQHEASLHAVMLTILALQARRRTGREDLVIGTTASVRETAAEQQVIGYYVNMLPVPCHLPNPVVFGAALRETQQALAAGLQHARYPFARIYHDSRSERPLPRHPARYPLFDLAVTENPEFRPALASLRLAPLSAPAYELSDASPGQDMILMHGGLADGGMLLEWHVNAALYTLETARYWLEALSGWAVWLGEDRQRAQEPLPSLLPHEADWPATGEVEILGRIDDKVDQAAHKGPRGEKAPPEDGLETEIARVWSDLLGRGPTYRDDNFFALGGHSLLAIAVAHRLEKTLGHPVLARELFAEPTLRGFAHRVRELGKAALQAGVFSDRATEGQQEFWVAEQAGLDTRGFNISMTLSARGKPSTTAQWRSAWAVLVARHDALRTGFHEDRDGVLRRSALPGINAYLEVSTQPDMPAALAHARERQSDRFGMQSPPLWRAGLVHVAGADQPVFWLALHHSVGDGVSLGVLTEELLTLLEGGALPPLAGHFDASAGREESYLAGPACGEDALYWRKILGGLGNGSPDTPQPFDEWQLDSPRPLGRTERNAKGAHSFRVHLAASTTAGLRDFARRNEASLHALLLTILAQEVRRRTGRPDFLLGTAASTRDSASEARIVGYYVNMLPVPCRLHGRESVEDALRNMQRSLAEGLLHARYPFVRMYGDFRQDHALAPHPARYPLFDLAVTENPGITDGNSSGLAHVASYSVRYALLQSAPPQDMILVYEGQPDGSLILQWYANAAIYEKETAEAWIDSLAGWARFLAEGKRLPGSPLPALLPEEENLLACWEQGPTLPHPAPSLPARFEHWARIQPERPALVTDQGEQSYAVLSARSNALAHALLSLGVARQERVGVLTDRSIALPETVLSIWKAGGCYLPLVRELPADRLAFIARDAGIRVLVVLDGLEPPASLAGTGCQVFRPESLSEAFLSSHGQLPEIAGGGVRGSELAYIIYTSGSTGVPKGVMLHHQGLINLGVAMDATLDIRSDDRAMQIASPAFDAWISDLAMAWTAGAAVVPALREEMDDIAGMRDKFARLGVTTATVAPSYLRLFEQADFPSLRALITAGEPPHRSDALHYAARLRYFNGYGPTENTVAASFGHVTAQAQRITAGKPLANTSVHILGSRGERVPPGAVGVVWLGGMGLAAGYLNRPDLTAASFVETPAGRRYCTGDLGRWTHTGELEILGRADGQVKLRGQRVELGEIEHRLGAHPGVRQGVAAVETQAGGTQTLWAFVCLHSGAAEPTQAAWHDYLSGTLPSYMLPSAVLRVPAIPVNTAGKVDRAALLRVVSERGANPAEADGGDPQRTQPRGGMERRIAQVWEEHLERRFIAREDNFFDLGGNSLRAISVVNQLRRTLQCTINDLYEHPRLADFANACRQRPEHLRTLIQSAARHWEAYRHGLTAYEAERDAALSAARHGYEMRNESYQHGRAGEHRDYGRVLLTGATGYLGSYLLRELLADHDRQVSVLVRGGDDPTARARLGEILCHYFGMENGAALRDNPRLTVLAGDLRRDDLGLSRQAHDRLASSVQAVFHCAANVKHFGHYWEFHADNVAGTGRLLKLAAQRAANPADFHLVSTLSTCGRAPETGFRLFTEYDAVPEALDENYYVRSKQEAERLVVAARRDLANACIHRVGNLVFAAEGGALQFNIGENAFFRQLAAFLRLGVAPDDSHLWLCHVDVVARGLLLLAGAADLINETHHLENARRDTLAAFVTAGEGVRACGFDAFLERLERAVDEPEMDAALTETLENFGLYRGRSPQERARRLEIVSGRTQTLLARLGLVWPPVPAAGQAEMLRQAARLFSRPSAVRRPLEPLP